MSMSKDRVEFYLRVDGTSSAALGKVFKRAFGTDMPSRGAAHDGRSTGEFVKVICRPSQFARFLIWRNEAGLTNSFRELDARLVSGPAVVNPVCDVTNNHA